MGVDPYVILYHPYVTEKTLNMMTGTPLQDMTDGNRLEFVVNIKANKSEIKEAFETLFEAEVDSINTHIKRGQKHAIIKLKEKGKAEEIGMRIGVF